MVDETMAAEETKTKTKRKTTINREDPNYHEKRERNNLASRLSRLSKKEFYKKLELENKELKEKLKRMDEEMKITEDLCKQLTRTIDRLNIQLDYLGKQMYSFEYFHL